MLFPHTLFLPGKSLQRWVPENKCVILAECTITHPFITSYLVWGKKVTQLFAHSPFHVLIAGPCTLQEYSHLVLQCQALMGWDEDRTKDCVIWSLVYWGSAQVCYDCSHLSFTRKTGKTWKNWDLSSEDPNRLCLLSRQDCCLDFRTEGKPQHLLTQPFLHLPALKKSKHLLRFDAQEAVPGITLLITF